MYHMCNKDAAYKYIYRIAARFPIKIPKLFEWRFVDFELLEEKNLERQLELWL